MRHDADARRVSVRDLRQDVKDGYDWTRATFVSDSHGGDGLNVCSQDSSHVTL